MPNRSPYDSRYDDPRSQGGAYPDDRGSYPTDRGRGMGDPRVADPDEAEQQGPEGEFPIAAVKHAFGKAKTKTMQIGVRIMIIEGAHKGKYGLWYGAFTPDAESITLRGMRALGHDSDDITDCSGFYNPDGSMRTQTAAVGVFKNSRDQNGKMRWRCEFINGGDVVMHEPLTANEEAAFRERMRAKLGRGGAQQSRRGDGPPPPRDDRRGPPPRDDRPPLDVDWSGRGNGSGGGSRW